MTLGLDAGLRGDAGWLAVEDVAGRPLRGAVAGATPASADRRCLPCEHPAGGLRRPTPRDVHQPPQIEPPGGRRAPGPDATIAAMSSFWTDEKPIALNFTIGALLAVIVVAAPILAAAWFALCPEYGNPGCPGGSAEAAIQAYRVAPASLLQAFLAVNLVMPYVYPLSYLAIGLAALRRSTLLATLGMLAGWVGSVPFGSFADQSGLLAAMARLHSDSQYAALIAEYMRDPHLLAVATGWVLGHLLGYVLLGAALLRSDQLPRWTGALLIAAAIAMGPLAYGTGINALQVGGYLAVAAACVPVGRSLMAGRRPA